MKGEKNNIRQLGFKTIYQSPHRMIHRNFHILSLFLVLWWTQVKSAFERGLKQSMKKYVFLILLIIIDG